MLGKKEIKLETNIVLPCGACLSPSPPLIKYLRKPQKTGLLFFPLADCIFSLFTMTVIVLFP